MARLATFPGYVDFRRLAPAWAITALLTAAACAPTVTTTPPRTQAPDPAPVPRVDVQPLPDQRAGAQKLKVGLLLPLSGSSAPIGSAMLEAAQLAIFDLADDQFELLPRDTKGTAGGAADAARDALAGGARLILGPLFGSSVGAVRPVAQNAGVSVVAFTNDVQQAGSGTYVMGFVPGDQVLRVVGYARAQGLGRVGALAPRNGYGEAVAGALTQAAQRFGTQVVRVERYDPNLADPAAPVKALANGNPSLDAVLLAEGGDKLRSLAPQLAANGIDPRQVRLLGTGLWDDSGVSREPTLIGGWFAAPAPSMRADFEARFETLYGRKPPRLATLAYDATAMAAVLAKQGSPTPFDATSLTNPNGFAGIDGLFRLRADGSVQRGLSVIEVSADGFRVIDPAPASFEALTQ